MSWQLASFALLALALAGGFAWFERSRPSSRTVALVATLAALATLGRIAFAPIPNVKPTTDIVLIAGYTLGGAPGFAVGAVAAIASNLFFGEGPWTPWEMLAWGLVGLGGAALAFAARRFGYGPPRRIPRVPMALICALAGFGYGLVVDCYQWLGYTSHSLAAYIAIEASSFGFNLAHAVGNLLFYLAFGPLLIRALLRFRARLEVSWGVVVASLLLLLPGSLGAGRVSTAQADSRGVAVRAAVRYLAGTENRDGGFGSAPGQPSAQLYTAWGVIGVVAAGGDVDAMRRDGHTPVSYIEAHLAALQGAGDIERTILALAAVGAPLHALVDELRGDQRPDGSCGEQSNLTAFAVLALRAAHAGGVGRAAGWLVRQQNGDGGFSFALAGAPSDVEDTAAAVEALVAAGSPRPSLSRTVAYLRAQQNSDGGFGSEPGAPSDAQSTAWAIQGLVASHVNTATVVSRTGIDPLTYLERLQTRSGAFDYARASMQTPVWVTAQVVAALAEAPLPAS
jgi:energy-coupling factor transport system substrate-specific component